MVGYWLLFFPSIAAISCVWCISWCLLVSMKGSDFWQRRPAVTLEYFLVWQPRIPTSAGGSQKDVLERRMGPGEGTNPVALRGQHLEKRFAEVRVRLRGQRGRAES